MCSNKEVTFNSFFSIAYRIATEDLFFKNFAVESKRGNDRGIIEIIREIPELKNLSIKEFYYPKNNEEAKQFLKKAEETKKNDDKILYITKGIFLIDINEHKIFFEALMQRIRYSFASEYFKKCFKDCQYMILLLNERVCLQNSEEINHQSYKIETLSYKTRCLKIMGDLEEAKILARDSIRLVKNYFQMMEDKGVKISNERKLEKLEPFLSILNEKNNDTKKCTTPKAVITNTAVISLPKVSGKQHNKLQSCSDAVTLRYDSTRGRHLVATRNIKTGSILIVDEPFAWSTDEGMLAKNCLHCHKSVESSEAVKIPCHNCRTVNFCSEDCRIESWKNYHRWECTIFNYFHHMEETQSSRLLLAYRMTVTLATQNIDVEESKNLSSELIKYYSNNTIGKNENLEIKLNDKYDPLDYSTIYSLQTNSKCIDPKLNLMHAIHSVMLAKSFRSVLKKIIPKINIKDEDELVLAIATLRHLQAINSNAYEIVENVLDKCTKIWEPKTIGGAIYATVSLTNHSCYPNIVRHTYPRGKVVVRAIRFIPKGTEIFDCYGPHFLRDVKIKRQEYLFKKYSFNCNCEACSKNLEATVSSALYKCKNCYNIFEKLKNSCASCGIKIDKVKIDKTIEESIKRRSIAIQKMLDGDYATALPILLHHAELVDKIFADYSLEALKTQQALIQCLNSMGCTAE